MQPFVSRTFTLAGQDVLCVFELPVPYGRDFRCDYRITFPTRERRACSYGVDSVQALLLAMQRAHIDLLVSPERREQPLFWLNMEELGLPLPNNATAEDTAPPARNGGLTGDGGDGGSETPI